ncbi:MAG: hypothetical protein U9Q70_10555 [Chloroflexota bacterium]|nr:hypothetical protein [Chloroflexota bacterium]
MYTVSITLPLTTYRRLEQWVDQEGRSLERLLQDLLERFLEANTAATASSKTARQVLLAAGRIRPLSDDLRKKSVPDVTLEEIRTSLAQTGSPALSEIVLEQRGRALGAITTWMPARWSNAIPMKPEVTG